MKHLSTLLPALLCALSLQAQYFEAGACAGASNYVGDLSGQRLRGENFNAMFGVFGRWSASPRLALKTSLTKGGISGSDKNARLEAERLRNLSFRSDLLELAVTGEWNLSPYSIRERKTGVPYLFAGVAAAHFNPQAQMRGAWHDLQPLRTEGKKYSRCTVAVPFGLGLKFNLGYKVNFGIEAGARKTFSDHLDDVSADYPDILELRRSAPTTAALSYRSPELTGEFGENPAGTARGDAATKDWYLFGGLTVSVNLTDKYGIDFDPQFDAFKPQPEVKKKKNEVSKRKKKAKWQQKFHLLKKKKLLEPQVKRRSN